MSASEYLRARLDDAFVMLEYEAEQLGFKQTEEKKLIPFDLFNCNAISLIKSVMHIVLFEKNYNELAYHYKGLGKRILLVFPEFDDLEINHIQIQGMGYSAPINTPTIKTPYGELVLGLPDLFIAEFYRNLKAAIVPANDGDNVVKVDFNGNNGSKA